MLKELSIRNFTLISDATIAFSNGFTAITGETGAGKSVLLKALRAVCGEKVSATAIRSGSDKASIEASFDISKNKKNSAKVGIGGKIRSSVETFFVNENSIHLNGTIVIKNS